MTNESTQRRVEIQAKELIDIESQNFKNRKSEMSENCIIKTTLTNEKTCHNLSVLTPESPLANKSTNKGMEKTLGQDRKSPNKSRDLTKKRKVTFREKTFVEVIMIESFKKYNCDMSMMGEDSREPTRCRCILF